MKKKHSTKHHKPTSFEKKVEKSLYLPIEERMLTAEGFRRRSSSFQSTPLLGFYKGRR